MKKLILNTINFLSLLFFLLSFQTAFTQVDYIPEEIPDYSINVYGDAHPGYIFITPAPAVAGFIDPKFGGVLLITDSIGNPVWYYYAEMTNGKPYQFAFADFNVFYDGQMSFGAFNERIVLDTAFKIIDTLICSSSLLTDNHDIIRTSDGHRHMLCSEFRIMDASALTTTNGLTGDTNAVVEGAVIQEYDATDSLIFEWKSLDHLSLNEMVDSVNFHQPGIVDFTHHNAIDIDHSGNYILSCRHLNQILFIERATSNIKWKLGGKGSSFTLINDSVEFTSQHDCRFTNEGNITIFDNGTYSKPAIGRMLEYHLDTINWKATLIWSYNNTAGVHSGSRGNGQKLENGNRLINWAFALPWDSSISIQEVDSLGNIVLDIDFMKGVLSYRAMKFNIPFKLDRANVAYDSANKKLYCDSNFILQRWSTGDTVNPVKIEQAGDYQAWTSSGIGYLGSKYFRVEDPFDSSWTDMITGSSARLNWTPIPGVLSYYIAIRQVGGSIIFIDTETVNSSYTVTGLQPESSYDWSVKALFTAKSSLFSLNNCFTTNNLTSLADNARSDLLSIFPNPSMGMLTIKSIEPFSEVELYNSLHKKVIAVRSIKSEISLDLNKLQPGLHILRIRKGEEWISRKIVIMSN
ncbi:MAG: T9SS type A sorting domain-containing protein [Chitinophagales bacterium]|nr:T9SS type A sorting domain-containing protein [Chitinophagales bacterium]